MWTTRYLLDNADKILEVNDVWATFALENGAPHLVSSRILGRCLWEFLDLQTRGIYELLFRRVREGVVIALPLHCNSPAIRREMMVTLTPVRDQAISVVCEIRAAYPIPYAADVQRQIDAIVRACSWCNRVALADGGWVNVELAMPRLSPLDSVPPAQITHGICPDCMAMVQAEIGQNLES